MACSNFATAENVRDMEQSKGQENKEPKIQAHHIIPKYWPGRSPENREGYRDFFRELGVDVEQWLTDVTAEQHYDIHQGLGVEPGIYVELWDTWITEHFDKVDADDVYDFAAQMVEDFGIPIQALG